MDVRTWRDLLVKLSGMSERQLDQPIQCVKPTPLEGDVQEMLPGIAIGTVGEFKFYKCRSTHDNQYHADDVVLLLDGNAFAEDGAVAYEWDIDADDDTPIYGKSGKTTPESQCSPQANEGRLPNGGFPPHVMSTVKFREESDAL